MSDARRADLAFFTAIAFGVLFIVLGGPLDRRLELLHINDFSGVWSGPKTLLLGVSPYDPARYTDVVATIGTQTPDAQVYAYMPWVVLALLPLALLPLDMAAWVWMAIGMVAATFALRAMLRAFLPGMAPAHFALGLALFVGQPGFHAIVLGQWSPLLMAAVAAAVLLVRRGRPWLAAFSSLLFLAKPQLFVFTALGLAYGALRRPTYRRYVVLTAVIALVIVAASWMAMPEWFPAWLADIPARRTSRSAVLLSALSELIGPAGRVAGAALIVAGAWVASRFRPGSDASLAAWISLSSAGAIYSWSYDQVLLFVPIVMACGVIARTSPRDALRFALAWAGVLLVVSPVLYAVGVARHDETFSCVVPDAAFIAIVALLWRHRHLPDADARRARTGDRLLASAAA